MKKSNLALTKFKPFIITTIVIITIIIAVAIIIMNHEVDGNENVKKKQQQRLDYKQNNNTAGPSHIFVYISSKSIARVGDKTSWWDVL